MLIKRILVIAIVLLFTLVLAGVAVSHLTATNASTIAFPPPPIHNHPAVIYSDGAQAIPAHKDGILLTVEDVQHYVSTHPFPAGPVVGGGRPTIETIQLITSHEASTQMRGENVGISDNANVYYVVLKGPFFAAYMSGVTNPKGKGPLTFTMGEEIFDARTGNLLVWGT